MKKKNKHIFKNLVFILVAVMCVGMFTPNTVQAKSKVAMNKTKVTVCTKKTYTLKLNNANKKVKWSTSDKSIVSIAKKSGKKSENCVIKTGKKKGTVTVTAKVGKKKYTTKVKVAGHKYGKVTYKWNSDYSKCTASKKCTRCHKKLSQTVKTSKKTTKKATCTEKGKRTYTAKFSKYDFGTKTKNVSISVKNHKVNTDKKISYKWNKDYSKCTATYYCKTGGEKQTETVKSTKQVTPATKTSEGKEVYTATFKTKGLKTQTARLPIPKVAYLDKTSITIKYGQPATIKVVNGTLGESAGPNTVCSSYKDLVKFDGGECDTTNAYDEDQDGFSEKSNVTYKKSKDMTSITFYAIKEASDKTYTVSLLLSNGQTLKCNVTTEFTPGDYTFGKIGGSYTYEGYMGWGKYKGKYPNSAEYVEYCGDKEKYDKYKSFFDNQTLRDGTTGTLEDLAAQTRDACGERANWDDTSIEDAMIRDGYDPTDVFSQIEYIENHPILNAMFLGNLYDTQGNFNKNITSQKQVDDIVTAWANEYNNGVMPSWYYSTVFSDWAEWSGRDIGLN